MADKTGGNFLELRINSEWDRDTQRLNCMIYTVQGEPAFLKV